MCQGVVWSRLDTYYFFSSEMLKGFFSETHFRKVLHFLYFCLYSWGFEFAPASISPSSVSDHGATNKGFTKAEHLHTGFARPNFLTVTSPTKFFASLFNFLVLYFFASPLWTLLFAVANFIWDGKVKLNIDIFPVQLRWRRYFSGSTPLKPLFCRLNALNAAFFPVKRP